MAEREQLFPGVDFSTKNGIEPLFGDGGGYVDVEQVVELFRQSLNEALDNCEILTDFMLTNRTKYPNKEVNHG